MSFDYQWGTLLDEFKRDFPGFDLNFNIMDRAEFVQGFHSSQQDPYYPDVAFVDNYSELGPLIKDNAVVQMWGQSRFPVNGWWVIFRQAKNSDTAKAFLLWLSQSPQWKPMQVNTASIGKADIVAVQDISKEAVQDYAAANAQSLWSLMDSEAAHFDDFGTDGTVTLQSVEPLLTFGNSRLAFVLLSEVGQGEKAFGMAHSAVILKKVGDAWKVLHFVPSDSLPGLENLLRTFDRLGLDDRAPEDVSNVTLLFPPDGAQIPRDPRSEITWAPAVPNPAAYVIESQFNQPRREYWSQPSMKVVSPAANQSSITVPMPFGVGRQPHRWRIWAIDKSGTVSTSDWRIIDFMN